MATWHVLGQSYQGSTTSHWTSFASRCSLTLVELSKQCYLTPHGGGTGLHCSKWDWRKTEALVCISSPPLPGKVAAGGKSTGNLISQPTTMLLGSIDSTASRNLNCTCWYSRWCSNVKYWTPLLVSTSCMVIPTGYMGDVGTTTASTAAKAALLLFYHTENSSMSLSPKPDVSSETPREFHSFPSSHE